MHRTHPDVRPGALTYSKAIEEISKLFCALLEFLSFYSIHDIICVHYFTTTYSININSFLHCCYCSGFMKHKSYEQGKLFFNKCRSKNLI